MSAHVDPVSGDFVRGENGKIKRFKPRYFRCKTCGARHHHDIPTKVCIDKQRLAADLQAEAFFASEEGSDE